MSKHWQGVVAQQTRGLIFTAIERLKTRTPEGGMQTKRISQGLFFYMNLKVPETS
jgi:hypothetical protein